MAVGGDRSGAGHCLPRARDPRERVVLAGRHRQHVDLPRAVLRLTALRGVRVAALLYRRLGLRLAPVGGGRSASSARYHHLAPPPARRGARRHRSPCRLSAVRCSRHSRRRRCPTSIPSPPGARSSPPGWWRARCSRTGLYWFVIDGLSVYIYMRRGLWLTAGLFVVYLVLIVIGYRAWRRHLRHES